MCIYSTTWLQRAQHTLHTMATENQKAVLGLLFSTGDQLTKKVLSAYSPTVKYQTNLQNLKRLNADHIEAAATFLGFNVRAEDKKLYKNLQILSDRVILKIESLFDTICTACGDTYCNTLGDTPLRSCYLCLQGSHNCQKMKEKCESPASRPPGGVWLCHGCLRKNDLALVPNITDPSTSGNVLNQNDNGTSETDEVSEDSEGQLGEKISPRRNRGDDMPSQSSTICEAYKKRECPHGLTGKRLINGKPCSSTHPPRCFRYCKHGDNKRLGCSKGNDCKYLHPKLCNNSVLKRVCLNEDCQYTHLKHTRRHQDNRANGNMNTERDNRREGRHASYIPGKQTQIQFNSESSSPYTPTIQKRRRSTAPLKDLKSAADESDSSSFLLQLIENMKEGIILQMSEKLTAFQATISKIVKEQLQMNRLPAPSVARYQIPPPHQLPTPAFPPHFPVCSY